VKSATPERRSRRPAAWAALVALMLCTATWSGGIHPDAEALATVEPAFAIVNGHPITRRQVDDEVLSTVNPPELYDLRTKAINEMVDDYLIIQAARSAGLDPDEYVARETAIYPVTEEDARRYYDQHMMALNFESHGQSFQELRGAIIAGIEQERWRERRDVMIAGLRGEGAISVLLRAPTPKLAVGNHPWTGAKDARVTVFEFSDYQCPFCRIAARLVKKLRGKYGDRVKFVFVDFPLGFHPQAMDAARAARCAFDQGKYWQYHDAIFDGPMKLAPADLRATAAQLGLNVRKFNACFAHHADDAAIQADMAQGQALGLTGTPVFFIEGQELQGAQSEAKFSQLLDRAIAASNPPAPAGGAAHKVASGAAVKPAKS